MTEKAIRAIVTLGDKQLDVFQKPNGDYGFSSTGLATILSLSSDKRVREILTSKELEPSTREALKFGKSEEFRLNLAKVSTNDAGNINFIPLNLMILVVSYEAMKGNKDAQAIMFACAVEALERRADAAFGKTRSEEERNQRLAARAKGIVARRTLTDAIAEYIDKNDKSANYKKFIFSNCSDHLNKIILGCKAKQAKEFYQLPEDSILRNHIPQAALRELELAENLASRFIDERGAEPLEAVKEACAIAFVKVVGLAA